MITNADIAAMSGDLMQLYEAIEDDLLRSIAEKLSVMDEIRPDTITAWHTEKLSQLAGIRADNIQTMARYAKRSEAEISKILQSAGYNSIAADEVIYQAAYEAGFLTAAPVAAKASPQIKQLIDAAITNTRKAMNLVNTTAVESANKAFMSIVNQAYLETSLGINDYTKSVRTAVRKLADQGITGATYRTQSGRVINDQMDVAVRRAIVTSASQTAGALQLERAKEWGSNYVEVTSHAGARPDHAVWQGRIFQLEGESPKYPNFYKVTDYGSVTGLKGANCMHDFYPFFPGISEQRYKPIPAQENAKIYEESQEQRKLERDIRAQKRRVLAAETTGDKEEKISAQLALKKKESQLNDFIDKTGRTKRSNRQQALNFGHSEASKAVWAVRKSIDTRASSVIMKSSDIQIAKGLGAAAVRDYIKLPSGTYGRIAEGSRITKVVVIAGKGTNKAVKVAEHLSKQYDVPVTEWRKVRGDGYVDVNGQARHAELHWFESDETGRVKMKVKRWFDEG